MKIHDLTAAVVRSHNIGMHACEITEYLTRCVYCGAGVYTDGLAYQIAQVRMALDMIEAEVAKTFPSVAEEAAPLAPLSTDA